jgi:uncharacterized membrane protein
VQPQTPQINPYGAPQAPVGDYVAGGQGVLERARSVPAGHALDWYREAWRLFKVSPGMWIGIWIVFLVCVVAISFLPFIGQFIVGVLTPTLVGGAMVAARNADREQRVALGDLFAGFRGNFATLLLIGLLQLVISLVVALVVGLVSAAYFGAMFGSQMADMAPEQFLNAGTIVPMMVMGIVIAVVFTPVTNAVWLAAGLAALDGAGALDALRRAFSASFRNLLPLLLLVVLTMVFAIVATIPFGLGWLVLGPLVMCVVYAQYRDLFGTTDAQS